MDKIYLRGFSRFVVLFFVLSVIPTTWAADVGTSVSIGNAVPVFTEGPAELVSSANGTGISNTNDNPTNVGQTITFEGTATDSNADQWKLLVCKTAGVSGVACDGGSGDMWCNSTSAVSSGSDNTCDYQVTSGETSESYAWYAYACDATACSTASQGAAEEGSPFYVNHAPPFTSYSNNGPKDPGATPITFTGVSDDTDTGDTVKLYVCASSGFTGAVAPATAPTCTGTQVCVTASGASADPTCTLAITVPTKDDTYPGYGYIVDNHGFVSSGTAQGTNQAAVVNNVAPVVSNVTLLDTEYGENDGTGILNLGVEEADTPDFRTTFTVSDDNSCLGNGTSSREVESVALYVYRSGIAQAGCTGATNDNPNNCYPPTNDFSWSSACTQDTGTCSGASDTATTWSCLFPLKYYADPTVTGTIYPTETWKVSAVATDDDSSASSKAESSGVQMDTFAVMNVADANIAYGSLSPGDDSPVATTTIEATGNVGMDVTISGTAMTSGGNNIAVGQQKYTFPSSETWANADYVLSGTGTERELNVPKTLVDTPASAPIYWILKVPGSQPAGSYSGTNTFIGVPGESANW